MVEHRVPDSVVAMELGRYLSRTYPMLPDWVLRKALKQRDVRVNGQRAGAGDVVHGGDALKVYIDSRHLSGELRVIYADSLLAVVEKPAGLPVDVDQDGLGEDTLKVRALAALGVQEGYAPQLCHRLDTFTGGLMLLSRTPQAHEALLEAFRAHQVAKTYQCLASGWPDPPEAALKGYLLKDERAARVQVFREYRPRALSIETRYRMLERLEREQVPFARLEVDLVTGRTHQIRAHLAWAGHPLLGDDKYGDRALNRRLKLTSPQLWCTRLELNAPGLLAGYSGRRFETQPGF